TGESGERRKRPRGCRACGRSSATGEGGGGRGSPVRPRLALLRPPAVQPARAEGGTPPIPVDPGAAQPPSAVTATSGFGPLLCPARGRTLWAAVRGRFRRAPGRGLPAGRLSRPGAGLGGGRRQFLTEARRRAGALGEMLPRQAAGALTGAAPPRAGRI